MAIIPIKIDRTSKPPLGTPLRSDGHWSVQGLVGAWAFNEGGGGGLSWSPDGVVFAGAQRISLLSTPVSLAGAANCAIYIKSKRPSANTAQPFYSACYGLYLSNSIIYIPGGNLTWYTRDASTGATGGRDNDLSTPAPVLGARESWAFVYSSARSRKEIWRDGQLKASSATSVDQLNSGIDSEYIGYDAGYGTYITTEFESFLVYRWDHNAGQTISLSANPWQIYEPETVWVEVGGGAEIFSGTFSTYIGDLIQSGVGQIGCGGGITANAGSAIYSMGGLEGKQGDLSIGVSNLLQLLSGNSGNTANIQSTLNSLPFSLSGNSGNSANFNSQLITITQSLIGQQGISAALNAAIANLSAVFGEQVVFQGTVSAVTATFVSSISVNIGNVGQALASISVASVISGITGNIGLLQGALNQISGQWIGNVGVSGSALMYVSTGTEMVGKLGLSASMASELIDIGAYLVEIVIGGKIDRIVISTKTGAAVILTTTGNINITTN